MIATAGLATDEMQDAPHRRASAPSASSRRMATAPHDLGAGWLEQRLSLLESQACAAASDIRTAVAAARRVGPDTSPEAAVTFARAWAAAGGRNKATRTLAAPQRCPNGRACRHG